MTKKPTTIPTITVNLMTLRDRHDFDSKEHEERFRKNVVSRLRDEQLPVESVIFGEWYASWDYIYAPDVDDERMAIITKELYAPTRKETCCYERIRDDWDYCPICGQEVEMDDAEDAPTAMQFDQIESIHAQLYLFIQGCLELSRVLVVA